MADFNLAFVVQSARAARLTAPRQKRQVVGLRMSPAISIAGAISSGFATRYTGAAHIYCDHTAVSRQKRDYLAPAFAAAA